MEAIQEIFSDKRFIKYCYSVAKNEDLAKELHQHCAVRLFEKKISLKSDDLLKYFKVTALNEWRHQSSKFNQTHRRKPEKAFRSMILAESSELDKFLNIFLSRNIKDEQELFHNEIFILYLSLGSTRKVAEKTAINYATISLSVKYYSEKIKLEYDKFRNS
jgi:hypothetical protein